MVHQREKIYEFGKRHKEVFLERESRPDKKGDHKKNVGRRFPINKH